jgi:hypothetical protein
MCCITTEAQVQTPAIFYLGSPRRFLCDAYKKSASIMNYSSIYTHDYAIPDCIIPLQVKNKPHDGVAIRAFFLGTGAVMNSRVRAATAQ